MASEFDISQAAASIYADSLLQLASDAGQAEPIGEELADLASLWKSEPAFASMMRSAAIDDDARRESLRKIFTGKLNQLTLNLLLVLNERGRSMILPAVCDAYRRQLAARLNQQAVHVTTAVALDDAQRKQLAAEVRRLSGKEAVFFEKVEPDLLGGMTVQIGDRLYDTSVRRRLRRLRGELLASVEKTLLQGTARFVTEG
jgi:F-type H+-transporting ATPase subunit delta